MKIGVDATCWQNRRGYGRHIRALFRALLDLDVENSYTFFVDSRQETESIPSTAQLLFVSTSTPTALAAASDGRRSLSDMWQVSQSIARSGCDLLIFPTVYSFVPVFCGAKKIVMIHDIIAEKYPQLTLPSRTAQWAWKAKVALGRWQADAIATVSEYSRQGIADHFNIESDKIFVVNNAGDPIFRVVDQIQITPEMATVGINQSSRYVVYVGGFAPHKNLEMLVEAFAQIIREYELENVKLVLVGEYKKEVFHSYAGLIQEQVARLHITDRVIFTGYLPDEQLVHLLNMADVLVLPSLIEGYGSPAVEAAACGCPIIATQESPLPGILGQGGRYIDPRKPEDLRKSLTEVLTTTRIRQEMGQAGLIATSNLTWDTAAHQMLSIIHHMESK
ncbi:glycosyltransferase family 4 protein [Chloroflexi bacterium TSY]|nr:glycosyltransferase family 4 protein [Chloroflexi bacterium TSY]